MTETIALVVSLASPFGVIFYFSKKVLGQLESFLAAITELQAESRIIKESFSKTTHLGDAVILHGEKINQIEKELEEVRRGIKKIDSFTKDCDTGEIKSISRRIKDMEISNATLTSNIAGLDGKVTAILSILSGKEK